MSKYDFEVDLSSTTSTGIILKKIKPGSTVLEFGCATGRMTRYMKEALNCKVYIVEYDKVAFELAMQYAVDGICADILELTWVEKFKDIAFDIVLFADVLEHLANPKIALSNVINVMKPNGQVYISLPNVTHNDILLKAYNNHFDYTKVGILDDTHIHFWGLENIEPFVNECGFSLINIEATYCDTGHTEQYEGQQLRAPSGLLNYFNERTCGNVYQFVISLSEKGKKNDGIVNGLKNPCIKSSIYYDNGSGFDEQNKYEVESEMISSGCYQTHFIINNVENIKKLRFDPIEHQKCIIQDLFIRQDNNELIPKFENYVELDKGILFLDEDPMVCVDIEQCTGTVTIDAKIILCGEEYENRLIKSYTFFRNFATNEKEELINEKNILFQEKEELINEKNILSHEKEELINEKNILFQEKEKLINEKNILFQEKEELINEKNILFQEKEELINEKNILSQEIDKIRLENESLHIDIGSYIVLANNKDLKLIEYEQVMQEKDKNIHELERIVEWYQRRLCVRACDKILQIIDEIKHKIFRRNCNE